MGFLNDYLISKVHYKFNTHTLVPLVTRFILQPTDLCHFVIIASLRYLILRLPIHHPHCLYNRIFIYYFVCYRKRE